MFDIVIAYQQETKESKGRILAVILEAENLSSRGKGKLWIDDLEICYYKVYIALFWNSLNACSFGLFVAVLFVNQHHFSFGCVDKLQLFLFCLPFLFYLFYLDEYSCMLQLMDELYNIDIIFA